MIRAAVAVLAYLAAYGAALFHLSGFEKFSAGEPLAILLIFGVACSGLAWFSTRGIAPRAHPVRAPAKESWTVLAYLAVFAVAFLGWGLSALKAAIPAQPAQEIVVTLAKLAAMVGLPLALFTALGYKPRELIALPALKGREWLALGVMVLALGALQLVVGRGPQNIRTLDAAPALIALFVPVTLAWMTIEAGLTEEFLFRVLVQTRFAAWFKSEVAGVVAMSLLFGLAHAPGYWLRGGHVMEGFANQPDPLTAIAYSIASTSAIGFMFGVLWARTRSLLLVALVHGWTDTIPNLAPLMRDLGAASALN
jgi:membrane protease YdiL (CAAX protease family)